MRTVAFDNLQAQLHDDRIQEEARIANDLQRDHPDMTRDEALRLAYKAFESRREVK